MLSLQVIVDLRAMGMKRDQEWGLTIRLSSVIIRTLVRSGYNPSAEMQLVYSSAITDWA